MSRDLTQAQFDKQCKRYGFKPQGFLGYYSLGETGRHVSVHNAGRRRRSQLAYLIQQKAMNNKQVPPRRVTGRGRDQPFPGGLI